MSHRVLIDTHVWLWWLAEPRRLPETARAFLSDSRSEVLVSAATFWEIAIKYRLGRLALDEPPRTILPRALAEDGFISLAVAPSHALQVTELPDLHRDPFDRILVAQCQVEHLSIMTADQRIGAYGVTLWSGAPLPA